MPAFAYLQHPSRFSKLPDVDAQRGTIAARASDRGLSVAAWFEDGPETSRTPLADRTAADCLCRQVQPGDHVLVLFPLLLSESLADLQRTVADWHGRGIILHFPIQGGDAWLDTAQTVDDLSVSDAMLRALEMIREQRRNAIREGILLRQLEGKRHGRYPPLGMMFDTDEHGEERPVSDPEELAIMRQIADWRNDGWTWESIYFELLRRRVTTRDGREWSTTRIRRAYDVVREVCESHSTANA
jgi:DNA invertase Pin-like site-specific DNA recombinase